MKCICEFCYKEIECDKLIEIEDYQEYDEVVLEYQICENCYNEWISECMSV